jgi:hypothetical protein
MRPKVYVIFHGVLYRARQDNRKWVAFRFPERHLKMIQEHGKFDIESS